MKLGFTEKDLQFLQQAEQLKDLRKWIDFVVVRTSARGFTALTA